MSDMTDPPFDLSCAENRAALVAALIALGIPATLRPDTPWPVVYVPLVNETMDEEVAFGIGAFEEDCPALVGVAGHRPDPDPEAEGDPIDAYSTDYYGEYTLGNTAAQVEMLWGERERLVAAFRAGHFDNGGLMEEVLTEEVLTEKGLVGQPEPG